VTSLNLGTTGTPQPLNLANVQAAISTSAAFVAGPPKTGAFAALELIDQGGEPHWYNSGEKAESAEYSWGDACDFGRGSIERWRWLRRERRVECARGSRCELEQPRRRRHQRSVLWLQRERGLRADQRERQFKQRGLALEAMARSSSLKSAMPS
jgi:hypothetical protein